MFLWLDFTAFICLVLFGIPVFTFVFATPTLNLFIVSSVWSTVNFQQKDRKRHVTVLYGQFSMYNHSLSRLIRYGMVYITSVDTTVKGTTAIHCLKIIEKSCCTLCINPSSSLPENKSKSRHCVWIPRWVRRYLYNFGLVQTVIELLFFLS